MKKPTDASKSTTRTLETDLPAMLDTLQKRLATLEAATANTAVDNATIATAHDTVYYPVPVQEKECCCFEITLYRARVLVAQGGTGSIEPSDGGGPLNSNMELIFGATADGFSAAYPGVASYVSMSANGGWLVFNQKVALVAGNQSIAVSASAREIEATQLESKAGKGEFGNSETAYMNLDCSCPVMPIQLEIQLSGGSINKRGLVLVELTAKKVCCPC